MICFKFNELIIRFVNIILTPLPSQSYHPWINLVSTWSPPTCEAISKTLELAITSCGGNYGMLYQTNKP